MTDNYIVLKRSEVEALRRHLQQECEAAGTIEGAGIAADALNRVEGLLADAPAVVDAGVWEGLLGLEGVVLKPREDTALGAPLGRHRVLLIEEKER